MLKRKRSDRIVVDAEKVAEMHPKNPYKLKPPDFVELASAQPSILGPYVTLNPVSGKGRLDFKDPAASRALTQAMLLNDFGIRVSIPPDHLCPPLPNRINYLCWISDLLDSTDPDKTDKSSNEDHIVLDVGVGPVCVYPLLGRALFKWKFVGTDIDEASVHHCQQNMECNENAKNFIQILHVSDCNELQERIVTEYLAADGAQASAAVDVHSVATPIAASSGATARVPSNSLLALRTSCDGDGSERTGSTHTQAELKGPILQAMHSIDTAQQPSAPVHSILPSESAATTYESTSYENGNEKLFSTVMTNPPFYDVDEQVSWELWELLSVF